MLNSIEIALKDKYPDLVGQGIKNEADEAGVSGIDSVKVVDLYFTEGNVSPDDLKRFAREFLADPVLERYSIGSTVLPEDGAIVISIGYNPGVMDPVEQSAMEGVKDLGIKGVDGVKTGKKYIFHGNPSQTDIEEFADKYLYNKVVQHIRKEDENPFFKSKPYKLQLRTIDLDGLTDDELINMSNRMVLSFDLNEMYAIRDYFKSLGRPPTDCELETIAQTWSEHCYHKTLKAAYDFGEKHYDNLLKETIAKATSDLDKPWCVSVFKDNAGIISFDDEYDVTLKVETHNHPSAIEPYGGAGTGIGGVIRDTLGCGLGAKPIANTDIFCFARPDFPQDELPPGVLHPKRLLKGVVSGVRDYGNRMGIPTINGAVHFDDAYLGNPLVYCGSVGLIPKGMEEKEANPGDKIYLIGGRTGRDGIHGATFSSVELTEESEVVSSGAVQIGNPIEEKKVLDAVLETRDARLYTAITDCGAGGTSSAVGEMGEHCGARAYIERIPLKYEGLSYWEIWISEAQERMVLAVPPKNAEAFEEICRKHEVEATDIGEFTDDRYLTLSYEGTIVAKLDMDFLHGGIPKKHLKASWTKPRLPGEPPPEPDDIVAELIAMLRNPDVASKEWIIRQYDHEVQGGSAVKPLTGVFNDGPSDAAVLRPRLGSRKGLIISNGINIRLGALDPYQMALQAVDEAVRNVICTGGGFDEMAILDNFCWGRVTDPERLGELVLACEGCYDAAMAYDTPFISGKDSLNNEFKVGNETIRIPPTLLISAGCVIDDVTRCITMDAKKEGSLLYIVGETQAGWGGSLYFKSKGIDGGDAPVLIPTRARKYYEKVHRAVRKGFVLSAHDCSDGGLAVAAAEMAFAGDIGLELNLEKVPGAEWIKRDDLLLFNESAGRILMEVSETNSVEFEALFEDFPLARIGKFTQAGGKMKILGREGETIVNLELSKLRDAFNNGLGGQL
jgi:phosphoribosylformylglycinamidine synthase II